MWENVKGLAENPINEWLDNVACRCCLLTHKLSEDEMKKLEAAWKEYTDPTLAPEERPIEELAKKYGLELQTLISYILGRIVMTRYGHLIKKAEAQGKSMEDFLTEVLDYYKDKEHIEDHIKLLELEKKLLLTQLTAGDID